MWWWRYDRISRVRGSGRARTGAVYKRKVAEELGMQERDYAGQIRPKDALFGQRRAN